MGVEENNNNINNKSSIFPATIEESSLFVMDSAEESKVEADSSLQHVSNLEGNQRCKCGCVPNIMSLFEMAEVRAKKRAADALKAKKTSED